MNDNSKRPLWYKLIVIAACLPVLMYPKLLSIANGQFSIFLTLYPAYVIAAGICAWICYPDRKEVAWILIILLLMTHAAMWFLVRS